MRQPDAFWRRHWAARPDHVEAVRIATQMAAISGYRHRVRKVTLKGGSLSWRVDLARPFRRVTNEDHSCRISGPDARNGHGA